MLNAATHAYTADEVFNGTLKVGENVLFSSGYWIQLDGLTEYSAYEEPPTNPFIRAFFTIGGEGPTAARAYASQYEGTRVVEQARNLSITILSAFGGTTDEDAHLNVHIISENTDMPASIIFNLNPSENNYPLFQVDQLYEGPLTVGDSVVFSSGYRIQLTDIAGGAPEDTNRNSRSSFMIFGKDENVLKQFSIHNNTSHNEPNAGNLSITIKNMFPGDWGREAYVIASITSKTGKTRALNTPPTPSSPPTPSPKDCISNACAQPYFQQYPTYSTHEEFNGTLQAGEWVNFSSGYAVQFLEQRGFPAGIPQNGQATGLAIGYENGTVITIMPINSSEGTVFIPEANDLAIRLFSILKNKANAKMKAEINLYSKANTSSENPLDNNSYHQAHYVGHVFEGKVFMGDSVVLSSKYRVFIYDLAGRAWGGYPSPNRLSVQISRNDANVIKQFGLEEDQTHSEPSLDNLTVTLTKLYPGGFGLEAYAIVRIEKSPGNLQVKNVPPPTPTPCPNESIQCPDGTRAYRTEPNCTFQPCPTITPTTTPSPNPTMIPQPTTKNNEQKGWTENLADFINGIIRFLNSLFGIKQTG
ncbi:MAG: hypothetical protein V1787_03515 [Candidatus Micrarchaeota archaeon]